jgi:hypothetical protein
MARGRAWRTNKLVLLGAQVIVVVGGELTVELLGEETEAATALVGTG